MGSTTQSEQSSGKKALRIAIVERRTIIEERTIPRETPISIGVEAGATFRVQSESIPRHFELFDFDGTDSLLRFSESMDAHLQLDGDKVTTLESLRQSGKLEKRDGVEILRLPVTARGKVMIGDVVVMFKFQELSAPQPAPKLPPEIRGSILQNLDAQFTIIFAVVAAVQISLVTYARSQPFIEPQSIEQIDHAYQLKIMPARPPEIQKEAVADVAEGGEEPKKEEPKPNKAEKKGPQDAEAAARAHKEAVKKKVAGTGLLKVLGAKGSGGGAIADVFSEGSGAIGDLGSAFSGIQGVDIASSGDEQGTRGGGSGEEVDIGELATRGGGSVQAGKKTEVAVKGAAKVETPEVDGELSEAQISSVMRRQLKALRSCYERTLKRNRNLAGKLILRFEILENGRTGNYDFEDVSLGSAEVVSCIKGRAKYWRFPRPKGGSVFVSYPIVFTPSA